MKPFLQLIILTFLFTSQNILAQADYDKWDNQLEIINEHLFNEGTFAVGIEPSEGLLTSFRDGYVELQALDGREELTMLSQVDWAREVQLEYEMKFIAADKFEICGIEIENYKTDDLGTTVQFTSFGVTADQNYFIYDIAELGGEEYVIQEWKESRYINEGEFNKYTIRKEGDFVYYFVNEILLKKTDRDVMEGNFINIFCGEGATIAVDRVTVAYKK